MSQRTTVAAGRANVMRSPGEKGIPYDINDVTITYHYHNRTDRTIRITTRNGLSFDSIPSKDGYRNGELKIFVIIRGSSAVIKNMVSLFYTGGKKLDQEQDRVHRALLRALDTNKGSRRSIAAVVEYAVAEETLDRFSGRMYLTEIDVVLEDPMFARQVHPFQNTEIGRRGIESLIPSCSDHTFVLSYRAIDNSGQRLYTDRYVNIGGEVFRIPVESDPSYSNGIHVTKRNPIRTPIGIIPGEIVHGYYSFEEADKELGLYTTAEQAMAGGVYSDLVKEQMAAKQLEDKLRMAELERELQEMRNEAVKMKVESDLSLHGGRTLLEWAKIGAGVFTTAVTLYTLWQKVKPAPAAAPADSQKVNPKPTSKGSHDG